MPLITAEMPKLWKRLEELVAAILNECGMDARQNVYLSLPRGTVNVDVLAEEAINGIVSRTICECKNWQKKVSKGTVHAFRTVMQETGAHRGYIISKAGFQTGALEAAISTNIELVTFEKFQSLYFEKWISKRRWDLEKAIKGFHTYYEPLGKPGYSELKNSQEKAAYDAVWDNYFFAGVMLVPFSPFMHMVGSYPLPELPFDVSEVQAHGFYVPADIMTETGYREFLILLEKYAHTGLNELRLVNPITRGRTPASIEDED